MSKKRKAKGRKPRGEEAEEAERNAQRELLAQEMRMSEVNERRQRIAWRRKLIALNLPMSREELEVAWHSFDRAVDDRDYSISVLLDDLRISNEQKRRADYVHAAEIDRLLEIFGQHLQQRAAHYETSIQRTLEATGQQTRQIQHEEQEKQLFLRSLVFAGKLKQQQNVENINTKNLSKLDGIKEENDNVLRMAAAILKRRLRNHADQLAGVLRDHEESTKTRRKDYQVLRQKDDNDQRAIASNGLRIEKLYELVHALKIKIAEYRRQSDKQIADCRFERDYFRTAYFAIQHRLLSEQSSDRESLKCVITEYNKTQEYFKKCIAMLEQILQAINICDKYETYEEKLLLYPLSIASDAICSHSKSIESMKEDHIQQLILQNYPLQKFSRTVSKVHKDVSTLKISIKNLIDESNQLKRSLRLYMDEFKQPQLNNNRENPTSSPVLIEMKDVLN